MLENLPKIFIVGAAKSGTTTLANLLSNHPRIYIPRKEPGFFAFYNRPEHDIPSDIRPNQITTLKEYAKLYQNKPINQVSLDATVANLTHYEHAIANFKEVFGDAANDKKFIIILRNPIERAFSHYKMMVKNGVEELPFEEAITPNKVASRVSRRSGFDYLGNSLYFERVSAYVNAFKNVKVLLQDDLKDLEKIKTQLLDFTELGGTIEIDKNETFNVSGAPKNKLLSRMLRGRPGKFKTLVKSGLPQSVIYKFQKAKNWATAMSVKPMYLAESTRESLKPHFEDDIRKLQELLGRDLSHWL